MCTKTPFRESENLRTVYRIKYVLYMYNLGTAPNVQNLPGCGGGARPRARPPHFMVHDGRLSVMQGGLDGVRGCMGGSMDVYGHRLQIDDTNINTDTSGLMMRRFVLNVLVQ